MAFAFTIMTMHVDVRLDICGRVNSFVPFSSLTLFSAGNPKFRGSFRIGAASAEHIP